MKNSRGNFAAGSTALELQHNPQRGRDLSHVLLAFSGAFEQAGKLAPGELRSVFLGQVFLDQDPDVGVYWARQRPRPVGDGQGRTSRKNTTILG